MQQKLIISNQNMKLEYYNQLQALDDKHKEFIHNTNHYIKTIGTLITENKNQDALEIINELNIELETNATTLYSSNSVLNSILSEKKTYALKNNVHMDIYVEPGIDFCHISDVDLITILSNLIDNAIEASIKCIEQHYVYIRIYMENQGNFCVTKIKNSFDGELKTAGTTLLSTKKEDGIHGVGLKSVKRATETCGGFIECYEEDNNFVAVLLLPVG